MTPTFGAKGARNKPAAVARALAELACVMRGSFDVDASTEEKQTFLETRGPARLGPRLVFTSLLSLRRHGLASYDHLVVCRGALKGLKWLDGSVTPENAEEKARVLYDAIPTSWKDGSAFDSKKFSVSAYPKHSQQTKRS